jgi:hypothetical protein
MISMNQEVKIEGLLILRRGPTRIKPDRQQDHQRRCLKMNTYLKLMLSVILLLSLGRMSQAQITMQIPTPDPNPKNVNFNLAGTTGFSVSYLTDQYRLYATTHIPRLKWIKQTKPDGTMADVLDDLYFRTLGLPASAPQPQCSSQADPRNWDSRCIDSIGFFWKRISCGLACADNDRWNASPGRNNISTFPSPSFWPLSTDYGVANFTPILNKDKVNAVQLLPAGTACTTTSPCPPKTGAESCFAHNPDAYATGTANSKAVQVFYSDGTSRWFMAFNSQIHSEKNNGANADDKWRILWAVSTDGVTWNVDPQILLRSVGESNAGYCGLGVLVSSLIIDNGYFYMTFTDVGSANVYLARSPINSNSTSLPGYVGTWSIATPATGNNQYGWQPLTLGAQQNFAALNAVSIMPTSQTMPGFMVKQSAIARVYTSSTSNSPSRYIGLTNDVVPGGGTVLQLWSTTSLTSPFMYQSNVDISGLRIGGNGLEFGFTQYADNLPSSPRIIGNGFDFWIVQNLVNPNPGLSGDATSSVTVTRRTARLTGGGF